MKQTPLIFTDIPFTPDVDALINMFASDDDSLAEEITDFVDDIKEQIHPKAIIKLVDITHDPLGNVSAIAGIPCRDSIVLNKNLAGIDLGAAYVITCGNELEQIDCDGDPLKEYWLDSIKLQALGAAGRFLRENAPALLGTDKLAQINPGSLPQWPISEQDSLFEYIGGVTEAIGVRVSESHLMIPLKSGSGIMYPSDKHYENCMVCTRLTCPNRRAEYDAHLAEEYGNGGCSAKNE